ncbi:hypothetical protein GGI59_006071 [Rhizobium lentis]|uniref:Uncharacterized protein n=1 Tax=Rhizobium lentis TaxID=1138194 RepID=A0A7W8XK34_9HYPH|nr:hypothetical protein [Rhizobium lentis]MBB5553802.1 hypothetical protein [Rhizobium lentis]MBB5564363.1 hypothetical protein [Rhizobium lentis]MBB5570837.1 hypothetical protein [Rhizobium lentis]
MFALALAKKTVFKHQVAQEGRRLSPCTPTSIARLCSPAELLELSASEVSEAA